MYMCALLCIGAHGNQMKAMDPLKQVIVIYPTQVLATKLNFSRKGASALKYGASLQHLA